MNKWNMENRQYVDFLRRYGLRPRTTLKEAYDILRNPWLKSIEEKQQHSPNVKAGISQLLSDCNASIGNLKGIGLNVYNYIIQGGVDMWNMKSFRLDFFSHYYPRYTTALMLPIDLCFNEFIADMASGIQLAYIKPILESILSGKVVPNPSKTLSNNLSNSYINGKEKIGLLEMYERNMAPLINGWKQNPPKKVELCAAFCNYLSTNDFFTSDKLETAKSFALARYGLNINSSINNLRRKKHKEHLTDLMNRIKREATQKYYGKL